MRKSEVTIWILAAFLSVSLALNIFLIIMAGFEPTAFHWRDEYDYVIIEIKCWVCQNGTVGFQPTAMVRIILSEDEPIQNSTYGRVHSPFKLDNKHWYAFLAPEEYYGKRFMFWQSEKTEMIIPTHILVLEPGFESDNWWMNYG